MSNLTLLVESLKREVAIPGTFSTVFPETTDDDLAGSLVDGFWRAKIDGWFSKVEVTDTGLTTPDLSRDGQQLVVLYAAAQIIRSQLRNLASRRTYKVGTVEATTEYGASALVQQLKDLTETLDEIRRRAIYGVGTPVTTFDGYALRVLGLLDYELLITSPGYQ